MSECIRCGGKVKVAQLGGQWKLCADCYDNLRMAGARGFELDRLVRYADLDFRASLPFRAMRPDEREQPATTFTSRRGPDLVDLIGLGFRALRRAA